MDVQTAVELIMIVYVGILVCIFLDWATWREDRIRTNLFWFFPPTTLNKYLYYGFCTVFIALLVGVLQ